MTPQTLPRPLLPVAELPPLFGPDQQARIRRVLAPDVRTAPIGAPVAIELFLAYNSRTQAMEGDTHPRAFLLADGPGRHRHCDMGDLPPGFHPEAVPTLLGMGLDTRHLNALAALVAERFVVSPSYPFNLLTLYVLGSGAILAQDHAAWATLRAQHYARAGFSPTAPTHPWPGMGGLLCALIPPLPTAHQRMAEAQNLDRVCAWATQALPACPTTRAPYALPTLIHVPTYSL